MILTWIHYYYDSWEMVFFYSIILSSGVSWHSLSSRAILYLFVCLSVYLSVSFSLYIFLLAEIHGFLFWAMGYICCWHYCFGDQLVSDLAITAPSHWLLSRFRCPHHSLNVLFWYGSTLQPHSPCPSLRISHFFKEPQIPVVEGGVQKSRPGHLVCSLLLGVLASRISQQTDL